MERVDNYQNFRVRNGFFFGKFLVVFTIFHNFQRYFVSLCCIFEGIYRVFKLLVQKFHVFFRQCPPFVQPSQLFRYFSYRTT